MTSLSDLVATAEPLRAWLESLPPDAVAGERDQTDGCPLARCIRATGYPTGRAFRRFCLPTSNFMLTEASWMTAALTRFTELVDRTRAPLTARKCLALLDRAEREAQSCP